MSNPRSTNWRSSLAPRWSAEQFRVVATLIRSREGSGRHEAARMVLVDGQAQADAHRATGIARSTVTQAVSDFLEADQLIRTVYGAPKRIRTL